MKVDLNELEQMVEQRYVRRVIHPDGHLQLFNYTEACTYEGAWNDTTRQCRGLILDMAGNVVARPFSKFFNYGEPNAPELDLDAPVVVTDKMDGCFPRQTALNLWDGGTITIGKVVSDQLPVILVGMDDDGNLVPAPVTDWHHNGRKDNWIDIEVDSPVSRRSGAAGWPNKIRVTTNHHIYVNGRYRPAGEIEAGDTLVTQTWAPDSNALRLIRDSLLGDGCVVSAHSGSGKYQESHSVAQAGYVDDLRRVLGSCGAHRSDTISGYGSHMVWAGSREYDALGVLRDEWYPRGEKRVPMDLSWVDEITIAKWLMDDGSLTHSDVQRDRLLFSTNGFPQENVERLARHLTVMYGVSCTPFNAKGWSLRVNAGRGDSLERLWADVAPHVHPSMRYKLPEQWRSAPYVERLPGRELTLSHESQVLSVEHVAPTKRNFPSGRTGFDVTTKTGNYLARGVLVHNSLGILYEVRPGEYQIATRGSFTSDQAYHASALWEEKYEFVWKPTPGTTPLFEIVFPANRIVVNYGDLDDIVLLEILDNETGCPAESAIADWPGPSTELHPYASLREALEAPPRPGQEGLVVFFPKINERVKIKQDDYVAIHRLVFGLTARRVWEHCAVHELHAAGASVKSIGVSLKMDPGDVEGVVIAAPDGNWMDEMAKIVPEEFLMWANKKSVEFKNAVDGWEMVARAKMGEIERLVGVNADRKQLAFEIGKEDPEIRGALYMLIDNKLIRPTAWRAMRPEHEVYKAEEGE